MDSITAARLIELNRDFYTRFGGSFSATRHRIQPGVRRALEMLKGDESILDLGCGNGELARALAKRGHRGSYLGADFSLPLLREAESQPEGFSATFREIDLTTLENSSLRLRSGQAFILHPSSFAIVFSFAVLHHIPSYKLRLNILQAVRQLLKDDGLFIHSNWQFLNSEKLKARIQPWEDAAISGAGVDAGDYLLDWRSGGNPARYTAAFDGSEPGKGLRYVHHFSEEELAGLAASAGFGVMETFYSDGDRGRLGLYQVWKPAV